MAPGLTGTACRAVGRRCARPPLPPPPKPEAPESHPPQDRPEGRRTSSMDIVVDPLSNHPELIPVAAEWHFREWGHTDPGGSLEAWTAGMARQAGADHIPGTLIALEDGSPVGVVCLVARDMPGFEPAAALTPCYYDGIDVTVMRTSPQSPADAPFTNHTRTGPVAACRHRPGPRPTRSRALQRDRVTSASGFGFAYETAPPEVLSAPKRAFSWEKPTAEAPGADDV